METQPTKEQTCCFTGHRPEKLPFRATPYSYSYRLFRRALEQEVQQAILGGYTHFITGMSRGMDLWAAEQVIAFKKPYMHVTLEAAIPCIGQPDQWSAEERAWYYEILSGCDIQTVISEEYTPGCMQRRNRYMVDRSSLVLAAYSGGSGGTRNTVEYAHTMNVEIRNLLPLRF